MRLSVAHITIAAFRPDLWPLWQATSQWCCESGRGLCATGGAIIQPKSLTLRHPWHDFPLPKPAATLENRPKSDYGLPPGGYAAGGPQRVTI